MSLCSAILLSGCARSMPLLDTAGPIGSAEKSLIFTAIGLMLVVAIPVFVLTAFIAWRYRASNGKATYAPKWSHSWKLECIVWGVPAVIIVILGHLVWTDTHALSPDKRLASSEKPITVDVVSLNWKWLFVYPRDHIATVNRLVLPANVPVDFHITSDTVLSAFFIPRLGSMIYAMPGMQTKLDLVADRTGAFTGRNYQFSGRGYSSMHFGVTVTSPAQYRAWVNKAQASKNVLDAAALRRLEAPSTAAPVVIYSSVEPHIFEHVIDSFTTAKVATPKSHAGSET